MIVFGVTRPVREPTTNRVRGGHANHLANPTRSHDTEITDTETPVPNDPGPSTQTDINCTNTDSMVDDIDGPEDTPSTSQQSRTKKPCMLYGKLKSESILRQKSYASLSQLYFFKKMFP